MEERIAQFLDAIDVCATEHSPPSAALGDLALHLGWTEDQVMHAAAWAWRAGKVDVAGHGRWTRIDR